MRNQILIPCFLVFFSFFSFSLKADYSSEIKSQIKERIPPIDRVLNSIDKAHLSKLSWGELKMALTHNQDLQEDIYKRMKELRDLIYDYSHSRSSSKNLDEVKYFITDYHHKLLRVISIFFNYHQKFGGFFPTMKDLRGLNIHLHKSDFLQLVDFAKMKAKHLDHEKIEIMIKEMEYVQIAQTTYLNNIEAKRKDYAHLIQFISTQQAMVNRGQLSQMDTSSLLKEESIPACMKRNLYLSEQKNYEASQHFLNQEEDHILFYHEYAQKINQVISELGSKPSKYISKTDVLKIGNALIHHGFFGDDILKEIDDFDKEIVKMNGELFQFAGCYQLPDQDDDNCLSLKDYLYKTYEQTDVNMNIFGTLTDKSQKILTYKEDSEEGKNIRFKAMTEGYVTFISDHFFKFFEAFFTNRETSQNIFSSQLVGDDFNKEAYIKRARRSYELSLYKNIKIFLKSLTEGYQLKINMKTANKAIPRTITKVMNAWESRFRVLLSEKLKNFGFTKQSKKTAHNNFIKREFLKSYPYLNAIYLTEFSEKNKDSLKHSYKKHPHKNQFKMIPDTPMDLLSLTGRDLVNDYTLCPQEEEKILLNLQEEIVETYYEMLPFMGLFAANPNDYFYKGDNGLVSLNEDGLNQRIWAHLGDFFSKRKGKNGKEYVADMKYYSFLQAQINELMHYAQSGNRDYLSPRMKKYVTVYGLTPKRMKEGFTLFSQRKTKDTTKENMSLEEIMSDHHKHQKERESLLWNIAAWKVGEYLTGFGLTHKIAKEISPLGKWKDSHALYDLEESESDKRKKAACVSVYPENFLKGKISKALGTHISSYTQDQLTLSMISFNEKKKMPSPKAFFKRDEDLFPQFKDGKVLDHKGVGHNYQKLFKKLISRWGLQKAIADGQVASGEKSHSFIIDIFSQKKLAKKRLNELYSSSALLRTPYELGTTGSLRPTAFRLLNAYDVSQGRSIHNINVSKAKDILRDTVNQAMRNSQGIIEKWCQASYHGEGNNQFKNLFRNTPLVRQRALMEIGTLYSRKRTPKESEAFLKKMTKIDTDLDGQSKSLGEKIHHTVEIISMVAGAIFLLAMVCGGVGFLAGAFLGKMGAVFGAALMSGAKGLFMIGVHPLVFSFFIGSYGLRMQNLYFKAPAALNMQFKIASTQIMKPLYTDWESLEKKIEENTHQRTSKGWIAWHIAEGLMNAVWARSLVRTPYMRYSNKAFESIAKEGGLFLKSMPKPLKPVAFKNIFKVKNIRGNLQSLRNTAENMVSKILRQKVYIGPDKTEVIVNGKKQVIFDVIKEEALNRRIKIIIKKNFSLEDMRGMKEMLAKDLAKFKEVKLIRRLSRKIINLDDIFDVKDIKKIEDLIGKDGLGRIKFHYGNGAFVDMPAEEFFGSKKAVFEYLISEFKGLRKNVEVLVRDVESSQVKISKSWIEKLMNWGQRKNFISKSRLNAFRDAWRHKDYSVFKNADRNHWIHKSKAKLLDELGEETGELFDVIARGKLDEAIDAYIGLADEKMFAIKKSMLDKLDRAFDYANQEKSTAYSVWETLLNGKGPDAFTLEELNQFMTLSGRQGRFKVAWELMRAKKKNELVFSRFKTQAEVFGSKFEFDKMANALKAGEKVSFFTAEGFKKGMYNSFNYLTKGVIKNKKTLGVMTLLIAGVTLSDDIQKTYRGFKERWTSLTGEEWDQVEAIHSQADFDRMIKNLTGGKMMSDYELVKVLEKYDAIFKEQFQTLEKIEEERIALEQSEIVRQEVDSLLQSPKTQREEYELFLQLKKAEADSLGISDRPEVKEGLNKIEELIERLNPNPLY